MLPGMSRKAQAAAIRRFHCEALARGRNVLRGSEAHHALNVIRLGVGDQAELFDGRGRRAIGRVVETSRREVVLAVEAEPDLTPEQRPIVHLGFATPKGKRLDWLLEKAVELGVAALTPVRFQRGVAGGDGASKRERREATCISACKQCGADRVPKLEAESDLSDFLPRAEGVRLLGDAGDQARPLGRCLTADAEKVTVLVGPEGGLTEAERDEALAAGFVPARVGHHVLRIETAAAALLAGVRTWMEAQDRRELQA
jgi:16S rRNA (uracil1498-N3)-methyltransferase